MRDAIFDDEEETVFVPEEEIRGGYRYCYYNADVPWDVEEGDDDARFNIAILEAREAFPDYVSPCNWVLISDEGGTVRVCRVSRV